MSNPFLEDLWKDKANKEKGEKKWKIDIFDIEKESAKVKDKEIKENIQEFLNKLKNDCKDYANIITNWPENINNDKGLSQSKEEHQARLREIETMDRARRAKHNVIVDDLNILSRLFARAGVDNSWHNYFVSYDQISAWANDMGKILISESAKK